VADLYRRMIWIGALLAAATVLVVSAGRVLADETAQPAAGPTTSADWPQYRGPTRDGIAPSGPKLLDAWPKEGPKVLWKSAALWPKTGGMKGDLAHAGCGSVSIADGRAFVFASFRRNTGPAAKVVLSTKDLTDLGWMEGVPDDLAKKIEEERIHGKGAHLKPGPESEAYVKH
jgi:hypothetical protein